MGYELYVYTARGLLVDLFDVFLLSENRKPGIFRCRAKTAGSNHPVYLGG